MQQAPIQILTPTKHDTSDQDGIIAQLRREIEEYRARIAVLEQHKCPPNDNSKLLLQLNELTLENQKLMMICEKGTNNEID